MTFKIAAAAGGDSNGDGNTSKNTRNTLCACGFIVTSLKIRIQSGPQFALRYIAPHIYSLTKVSSQHMHTWRFWRNLCLNGEKTTPKQTISAVSQPKIFMDDYDVSFDN
jgi:hypothetical protein